MRVILDYGQRSNSVMQESLKPLVAVAETLAARLLRLLPERAEVDWSAASAAFWHGNGLDRGLSTHGDIDDIDLDDLREIDDQKARIVANTRQFLAGYPANNALLWGARGTGKSSLVHGLLNEFAPAGLRLVEVHKTQLAALPEIAQRLRDEPYKFVLFCDDLSFEANDDASKSLKSALEGSIFKGCGNAVIYATSNRRHLLPETMADNQGAGFVEGELHQGDALEEKISLSDRFGLWLSFHPFRQAAYLAIARHWIGALAERHQAPVQWNEDLQAAALRWALGRGARNGRTAQHFAKHWVGQALLQAGTDA